MSKREILFATMVETRKWRRRLDGPSLLTVLRDDVTQACWVWHLGRTGRLSERE